MDPMTGPETIAGLFGGLDGEADREQAQTSGYERLLDDESIRLLILDPGEPIDPLTGALKVTSINSSELGSYEALSYVWGTGIGAHKILLRSGGVERAVKLTANLYEALSRLRYPDKKRSIWADQICIDQGNLNERSHQVQFMNQLYRHAGHVLVWLGLDVEGIAQSTFSFIFELDEMFQNQERGQAFHVAYTKELDTQSKESWVHLDRLMNLEWFTRGWVVQEIGTAAPATLIWGEAEIDWAVLCRVCEKLQNYYHFRSKFKIRTDEVRYLFQRFVKPSTNGDNDNRSNFIYELHRARRLKFSDQRDRVFAWLGHFSLHGSNKELNSLSANYAKTMAEAYIDVAKRALKSEYSTTNGLALIALAAVQHDNLQVGNVATAEKTIEPNEGARLPSWVPDWRIFRSFILTEPASPHRAHGTSTPKLEVYDGSPLLRIHGLEVDTIEACSRPLAAREFHAKSSPRDLEPTITYIWREICRQNDFNLRSTYRNGESSFFACMQTLGNGCVQIARRENLQYSEVPKSRWLEHEAIYLTEAVGDSGTVASDLRKIAERAKEELEEEQWSRSANGASENRVFARTRKGYYVLGPGVMEQGDVVCVLFGGKLPFVLRSHGDHYLLVGECYSHGLMEGQAMRMADRKEIAEKVFEII